MNKAPQNTTWALKDALALYQRPFQDLIFEAQTVHRKHFNPNEIQASTLVNIQQGGCPEDCKWCSQSIHNDTKIKLYPLMKKKDVLDKAILAKQRGASRICLGAAWRTPTKRQLESVGQMVQDIKALGLETCVTLGQLTIEQAKTLKAHGLDYYNHNLESSPEHFKKMTTTRKYEDRLKTLHNAQQAKLKLCSGGIVGMGETLEDQITLLVNLANLQPQPQSVPINQLIPTAGTLTKDEASPIDHIIYVRLIAIARIMMPRSYIRLSAGRHALSETAQTLAFLAGANSFFLGEKLLTLQNKTIEQDNTLLKKLGMHFDQVQSVPNIPTEVCVHEC